MNPANTQAFLPEVSTVGIIGGGQLARMSAIAAQTLGYKIVIFSDSADCPAASVAHDVIVADYSDTDALKQFAEKIDVVTLEFENIPVASVEFLEQQGVPARPGSGILSISQDRNAEKTAISELNIPVTPFQKVITEEEARAAFDSIEGAAVLKTARLGYDGKGQKFVYSADEAAAAFREFGGVECCLEQKISLAGECSVLIARSPAGGGVILGPIKNEHKDHILFCSTYPSGLEPALAEQARNYTLSLASGLNYVGLLCAEFFIDEDNRLYLNEIAPRPHNSGHLTIDAFVCSQFEHHIRAVCGLPAGSVSVHSAVAMVNILGDSWNESTNQLNWESLSAFPDARVHLYGKTEVRKGRKMGHLTVLGDSVESARAYATEAHRALSKA